MQAALGGAYSNPRAATDAGLVRGPRTSGPADARPAGFRYSAARPGRGPSPVPGVARPSRAAGDEDAPSPAQRPGVRPVNRAVIGLLVAAVLAVGVIIGVGAGGLFGAASTPAPSGVAQGPTPGASSAPAPSAEAGGSGEPPASEAPSVSVAPSASPTPAPTPVLVAAPLDGVPVKPALAHRHVIVVMIDDLYAARPQSGLSDASVVWQAPAEGGIPRYMAFFQEGTPPSVGPVRSSRLYFIAWASEWRAAYVHAGGSPQAKALLASAKGRGPYVYNADALRWEGRHLFRTKNRVAPHNLYTTGKLLQKLAKRVGAQPVATPKAVWRFAPDAPLESRPQGTYLRVPYLENKIVYRYDRKTNTYLRSVSVEGKQVDAATKQRIAPKNVVVMSVSFAPLAGANRHHRLEAQVVGSGPAWISTNGKTVKGTWKKNGFKAPTRFFGPDGKPVTLTIGQTFVQVVPRGTRLTIKNGKVPPAPAAFVAPTHPYA
jgi:Protein of unknown function (DUF3048) N-terminal domain/Protein of unknown function (DUF3048) C-terminal domain